MSGTTSKGTVIKCNAHVIAGITDFSDLGGGSAAVIDATDLASTMKEKLPGLGDEGQLKLTLNLIPSDEGQIALETSRTSGAVYPFVVTFANGDAWTFNGFVLSFAKSGGVNKLNTGTATIEVTGQATFTAHA